MLMGLETSFSDQARFPELAEESLKIDQIIHQTFVDVNEERTEAGASTVIGMGATSQPPVFRADHPFVYFILENGTDVILFMGRYAGPK
jgi:serpin B